jgi:imidazolonepropionase
MSTLAVRGIGELCTCDPDRGPAPGVIRDAAVIAEDGVITYAGEEANLAREQLETVDEEIICNGAAVLPGFVDAHSHAVWLGDRRAEYERRAAGASYEEIAAAGGGIRATVRATAAGSLEELVAAARPRVRAMLAHGTTTVEIKSGYGMEHDAEMRQLDAALALRADPDTPDVVTTYLPLHAPPDGDRSDYIAGVCADGLPAAATRARFVDAFCDEGAFTVEECERLFTAAAAHGLRPKLHAEQRSHSGAALLAARSRAVSADHLEHADDADLRALAAAGVACVILPGASLVLGGPPPPGRRILDARASLAIATDCNPGTCFSESMPLMLSLAVALAGVAPGEALVAGTRGGAAALGLRDRGVIRVGARCDLVVLSSSHWVDVAYHLGGDVVSRVILAGRVVHGA